MKPSMNLFAAAMILIALAGCADEVAQKDPAHINFSIADKHCEADLPAGTTLLVSMETSNGDPIYDLKEISFSKDAQGFTTAALDLKPGGYVMTEFMLVNPDGKILYATPQVGAPLSGSVRNPVGFQFDISANDGTDIKAEVLPVEKYLPADLGLTAFSIKNSFQVEVSEEGGGNKNVSAQAYLLKNQDTVANLSLPEYKGRIAFDGDLDETYTLVVTKDGSEPYVQNGTITDLVTQYQTTPLRVALKNAFTMIADVASTDITQPFSFTIGGTGGEITVNWGDGAVDPYSMDGGLSFEVAHTYANPQDYPITITGNLNNIEYFYSFYGASVFREINFRNLPNLIEIRYGLTNCPSVIDLSRNSKLEFAMLPHLADMETLILPKSHEITFIEIDGINGLDSDDIDVFVNNMYSNTIKKNLTNGLIGMRGYWAQEETDFTMVGPPSAQALAKLFFLRDNYGWTISPSESAIQTITKTSSKYYGKRKKT